MEQVSAISIYFDGVLSWCVNYNGGESPLSEVNEGVNTIQLSECPGLQPGQECWPLLEPTVGPNHNCGDNVAYDPAGGTARYNISNGTMPGSLSCSLQ
jgi:hypothetical protein